MTQPPILLSDIASDILSHVPVVGVLKFAIQEVMKKRLNNARDILIEEIKNGNKDLTDASELEDVAAIIYRYARAAQEGSARLNLRILAQVISGQKQCGVLKADEFLYYADIISSLRYEEIVLLGCIYKHVREPNAEDAKNGVTSGTAAIAATKKELIPTFFKTESDWDACFAAILRTGLLTVGSGWGALIYDKAPLMDKLCQWCSFEDALKKES